MERHGTPRVTGAPTAPLHHAYTATMIQDTTQVRRWEDRPTGKGTMSSIQLSIRATGVVPAIIAVIQAAEITMLI